MKVCPFCKKNLTPLSDTERINQLEKTVIKLEQEIELLRLTRPITMQPIIIPDPNYPESESTIIWKYKSDIYYE